MSFRKPIEFLLWDPFVAFPIKQALREVVAAEVRASDAHLNNSDDSCIEYIVCGKAQSESPDARRKAADAMPYEAMERIASFHGV